MNLSTLYEYADQQNIDVDWLSMSRAESLSVQLADGSCAIALDPWRMATAADEAVKLAHELGHCETGSFYNRYSPFDLRQKHERHADIWAIKKLIPEDELINAIKNGIFEPWDLAEFFCVTDEFMYKALELYEEDLRLELASCSNDIWF